MTDVSIDDLKAIQRERGLGEVHVVDLSVRRFAIAHTDDERASGHPLEECDLHRWLMEGNAPPVEPGLYIVYPHEPDAYSEDYGRDPWDFEPLR